MKMATYLDEIKHAVTAVLGVLWSDVVKLDEQRTETAKFAAAMDDGYRRAAFFEMNPDLDDEGLGTFIYYDTYFGADKDRANSASAEQELAGRIQTLEFSNAAMAGSLLQYGKQGISIVHGERNNCPAGRALGTQNLRDVIWQARNQAMHWDEGHLNAHVVGCFQTLSNDFGPTFLEFNNRSLARDVVERLGWRDFAAFRADLEALA